MLLMNVVVVVTRCIVLRLHVSLGYVKTHTSDARKNTSSIFIHKNRPYSLNIFRIILYQNISNNELVSRSREFKKYIFKKNEIYLCFSHCYIDMIYKSWFIVMQFSPYVQFTSFIRTTMRFIYKPSRIR